MKSLFVSGAALCLIFFVTLSFTFVTPVMAKEDVTTRVVTVDPAGIRAAKIKNIALLFKILGKKLEELKQKSKKIPQTKWDAELRGLQLEQTAIVELLIHIKPSDEERVLIWKSIRHETTKLFALQSLHYGATCCW